MEELLQNVTAVRRNFEERRKTRPQLEGVQCAALRQQPNSPHLEAQKKSISKLGILKNFRDIAPINTINKLNLNEFSKFLQSPLKSPECNNKSSPLRRAYKLDAAALLTSRIKQFLSKKFRIWRQNAEKLKNSEKKFIDNKALVFQVNTGPLQEKKRYISREKYSDEEVSQKALTSRLSPRSPVLFDFNQARVKSFYRTNEKRRSNIETNPDIFDTGKNNVKKNHILPPSPRDRKFPSTTRAASSFSQRSYKKNTQTIIKTSIDVIFKILSKIYKPNLIGGFKLLKKNTQISQSLLLIRGLLAKKETFLKISALTELKNNQRFIGVFKAVSIISDIFLRTISEYFHFMKFRCIVESGLFDDSMDITSDDELKECIDSIQKTIDTNRSLKRKDSVSRSGIFPLFVNLLISVEESVKIRYYKKLMKKIFALNEIEKIKKFVHIIDKNIKLSLS